MTDIIYVDKYGNTTTITPADMAKIRDLTETEIFEMLDRKHGEEDNYSISHEDLLKEMTEQFESEWPDWQTNRNLIAYFDDVYTNTSLRDCLDNCCEIK